MPSYRITKYDPQRRAPDGAYPLDEWTAFSDIGRTFAGETLTQTEYLRVEDLYLDAITCAMRCAGVDSVVVTNLENHGQHAVTAGTPLDPAGARDIARLALRSLLWCKLLGPHGFYVHFGYDYYMYIGGSFEGDLEAEIRGMFVEELESPYR